MSELKEIFKPEFAKGLVTKGGDKVEINYPDSSAGKFVALYGFDDLFESLPDNIQHLLINNKSKEDIALVVPESIGRFKSLQALLLQNIVKSIPDNVGELKNLNFIALPDNKELVDIPESIADLPNLAFVNLKGSPKVKIPAKLKEKLSDEGSGFYYVS
jgi:Leucine-rich repeat (LRR) protein